MQAWDMQAWDMLGRVRHYAGALLLTYKAHAEVCRGMAEGGVHGLSKKVTLMEADTEGGRGNATLRYRKRIVLHACCHTSTVCMLS